MFIACLAIGDVLTGLHCIYIRELPPFHSFLSIWLTLFCYQMKNLGANLPAPLDDVHNGYVHSKLNKYNRELAKY